MRRRYSFVLAAVLLPIAVCAQLVTTEPAFITAGYKGQVTITFNPAEGNKGMLGATACYAHTGLITEKSTGGSDWRYATPQWRGDDDKYKMTKDGANWKLVIDNLYDYYGCPETELIKQIAFVFNDGPKGNKEGKTAEGSDIFVAVYEPGLHIKFDTPVGDLLVQQDAVVDFSVSASEAADLTLRIGGQTVETLNGMKMDYTHTFDVVGDYLCIIEAKTGQYEAADTLRVCVTEAAVTVARPEGLIDGINYDPEDDTKASLVMYAMDKDNVMADNVFVIGDFNGWTYSNDYQMKKDAGNQGYFWLEMDGLEPGKEYAFQYAVKMGDKVVKISDPYTEKVLDPWNDQYIVDSVYPGLPVLPDEADGLAAVLQTAKPEFEWSEATLNFERPHKDNLVIYELWIYDFTPVRTVNAVISRLDYIENLGVNVLELMPITEFDGNISWGYNPNHYFAPDKAYGTAEAYKTLIDECHKRGIAVVLDMVFNHASGINPFAKLYYGAGGVADNNPWFNTEAPHIASVHQDFNHDFAGTQEYFKRVLKYWIEEYKIDGYRMDLTKGFCGSDCNNRVNIINDYYAAVKEVDPEAYFILEHWEGNEEPGFVSQGMMCWGGGESMANAYSQLAMGWLKDGDNISAANKKGWVYYAESHDEERNQYKARTYGNGNVKTDYVERLQRVPLVAAFNVLLGGPKMMWQFQELGFDFSINSDANGVLGKGDEHRTSNKPQPQQRGWFKDTQRMNAYARTAQLVQLRTKLAPELFQDGTCKATVGAGRSARYIQWEHNGERIIVVGNFNVNGGSQYTGSTTVKPFTAAGTWYDYYAETEIIANADTELTLAPGELRIYTTTPYELPEVPESFQYPDKLCTPAYEVDCTVYPTFVTDYVHIRTDAVVKQVKVLDLQGRQVIACSGDVVQVDLSALVRGMYLMVITFDKQQQAYKVIKQ